MNLTRRETDCLEVIRALTKRFGISPSFDEIKTEMGLSSCEGVFRLVNGLEQKGHIRRRPFAARSIEVINPLSVEIARLVALYGAEAVKAEVAR